MGGGGGGVVVGGGGGVNLTVAELHPLIASHTMRSHCPARVPGILASRAGFAVVILSLI